jgi:hypothetical protein
MVVGRFDMDVLWPACWLWYVHLTHGALHGAFLVRSTHERRGSGGTAIGAGVDGTLPREIFSRFLGVVLRWEVRALGRRGEQVRVEKRHREGTAVVEKGENEG